MKTSWPAPKILEFPHKPRPNYNFIPPHKAFQVSVLCTRCRKFHSGCIQKCYPTTFGPDACHREKSGGRNLPHQSPRGFPTSPGHTRKLPATQPDHWPTTRLPPTFPVTQPRPPPPHHDPRPTPPKTPYVCPEPLDSCRDTLTLAELLKISEPGNISFVSNLRASLWCGYTN